MYQLVYRPCRLIFTLIPAVALLLILFDTTSGYTPNGLEEKVLSATISKQINIAMHKSVSVPNIISNPSPFYEYSVRARHDTYFSGIFESTSINDNGIVAFLATSADSIDSAHWGPHIVDEFGMPSSLGEDQIADWGGGIEINNINEVAFFARGTTNLVYGEDTDTGIYSWSDIDQIWSLRARGEWPDGPLFSSYREEDLSSFVTLNNSGQIAFAAADGFLYPDPDPDTVERYFLGTPLGTDFQDGFNEYTLATDQPLEFLGVDDPNFPGWIKPITNSTTAEFRPMIADDGRIVMRSGLADDASIEIFNYNLDAPPITIAKHDITTDTMFTRLGKAPAISDDSKFVVFTGDRGNGPGLFLSVDNGDGFGLSSWSTPFTRVIGEPLYDGYLAPLAELGFGDPLPNTITPTILYFEELMLDTRLDVIHIEGGEEGLAGDSAVVAFMGRPNQASRDNPAAPGTPFLFSEQMGLWTVQIDFRKELTGSQEIQAHINWPIPVVQIGDVIDGVTVEKIDVYDPLSKVATDESGVARTHSGPGDHQIVFRIYADGIGAMVVRGRHLDTDADGLLDHWEEEGIDIDGDGIIDLDLPALGANPLHKDIFLEIDWLTPRLTGGPTGGWSNELFPGVTAHLANMFATAPVTNPNGANGVTLHIDAGGSLDARGEPFSNIANSSLLQGGELISQPGQPDSHIDLVHFGEQGFADIPGLEARALKEIKNSHFGTGDKWARELAFHYAVLADFSKIVVDENGKPFVGQVDTATEFTLKATGIFPTTLGRGGIIKIIDGDGAGQLRRFIKVDDNKIRILDQRWDTIPANSNQFVFFSAISGNAEGYFRPRPDWNAIPGNDFIVSFGGVGVRSGVLGNTFKQWRTIAHELGHNLGLRHCGISEDADDCINSLSGITIRETGETIVSEGGLEDWYTIQLDSQPTDLVTVTISSVLGQVEADPDTIIFDQTNWNDQIPVTVRATSDGIVEDFRHAAELIHHVSSHDIAFADIEEPRVRVTVYDDQAGLITLKNGKDAFQLIEGAPPETYQVYLTRQPLDDVTIEIEPEPPFIVSPAELLFRPTSWMEPQMVAIEVVDNITVNMGLFDIVSYVGHSLNDPDFDTVYQQDNVNIVDDERPGFVLSESQDQTLVIEEGPLDSYTIALNKAPTADVMVTAVSESSQVTIIPTSHTFSPGDWSTPKTFEVKATDDANFEPEKQALIIHQVQSSDSDYANITGPEVIVSVRDNETTPQADHRSLMSYAHQIGQNSPVNSYARSGDQLYDEWSNLRYDFYHSLPFIGHSDPFIIPPELQLGFDLADYEDVFGKIPDLEGPQVTIIQPISGTEVPLNHNFQVILQANDATSEIGDARLWFDLDGNGFANGPGETITPTLIAPGLYQGQFGPLTQPTGLPLPRTLTSYIVDELGNFTSISTTINVVQSYQNDSPIAENATHYVQINQPLSFLLEANDPNASPLTYDIWNLPDHGTISGEAPNLVYTPDPDFTGSDFMRFRALDSVTHSSSPVVEFVVNDTPPYLETITNPVVINESETLSLSVKALELDGQPLTVTLSSLPSFATYAETSPTEGTIILAPLPGDAGFYPGQAITATDGTQVRTSEFDIYVLAPADVSITKAVEPADQIIPGQKITYTLVYSNSGPATAFGVVISDPLPAELTNITYTASNPALSLTGNSSFEWDVGIMPADAIEIITVTGLVEMGLPAGTTITNTASISALRDDDATNNSATAPTIIVINGAPIARPDAFVLPAGSAGNLLPVLSNDADPNGDAFTLTQFSQPSIAGVVTVTPTGFSFTPTAGFVGTDTFTYTISDGLLAATTAVTLTVVELEATNAWTWENPKPQGNDLRDIECLTPNYCLAVGKGGTIVSIINNADGQFEYGVSHQASGLEFKAIDCPNSTTCVVAGKDGTILRTTSAGAVWTVLPNSIATSLEDLSCSNTSECIALRIGNGSGTAAWYTNDGGQSWTPVADLHEENLYGIHCQDDGRCLAVGRGEFNVGGIIWLSNDAGQNWQVVANTTEPLYAVTCYETMNCLAVGDTGNGAEGIVYRSQDGGVTWSEAGSGLHKRTDLISVSCLDSALCIAVSDNNVFWSNALIARSEDGGLTWEMYYLDIWAGLQGVSCTSSELCLAVGDYGTILGSEFGAKKWSNLTFGLTSDFIDIYCWSTTHCLAPVADGSILGTVDGGDSWQTQYVGQTSQIRTIDCQGPGICIVAGLDGLIMTTDDGGDSWVTQTSGTSEQLDDVHCYTANDCIAVGMNQTVLLSADGGIVWNSTSPPFRSLTQVHCFDSSLCTGAPGDFDFPMISNDGGANWRFPTSVSSANSYYVWRVACISASQCLAITKGGTALVSSDSGENWTWYEVDLDEFFPELACPSSNSCLAVDYLGRVFESNDGGINWTEHGNTIDGFSAENITSQDIGGLSCASNDFCLAVGKEGGVLAITNGVTSFEIKNYVQDYGFWDINCLDQDHCLATTGGINLARWRSDEGWSTEVYRTQNTAFALSFLGLDCIDTTNCIAVTSASGYDQSKILRTGDGGQTWQQQDSGFQNSLNDIDCYDANFCAAVGADDVLLTTSNGGITWTLGSSATLDRQFRSVSCMSATHCVAVGFKFTYGDGIVYVTSDAGASWQIEYILLNNKPLNGVDCPTTSRCVAVGQSHVLITGDSGNTWSEYAISSPLNAVECLTINNCLAVGDNGLVMSSNDGGLNWSELEQLTSESLGSIACSIIDGYCWVGGTHLLRGPLFTSSPVTMLPIQQSPGQIELSWEDGGYLEYQVWRSSSPYFTPGNPDTTLLVTGSMTTTTDVINGMTTFYEVVGIDGFGQSSPPGAEQGIFFFPLQPGETDNQDPIAEFSYEVNGLTVNFTDQSSDPDGQVTAWQWDFGDGNTDNSMNTTHSYTAAGSYDVMLTVTDNIGATDIVTHQVTVSDSNPTTEMYIGDLSGSSESQGNKWTAHVTVLVLDEFGTPAADAQVMGSWSDGAAGSGSCLTDVSGFCTVTKTNINNNRSSVTFTVDDVTHATFTYNAALNVESSIIVLRPG